MGDARGRLVDRRGTGHTSGYGGAAPEAGGRGGRYAWHVAEIPADRNSGYTVTVVGMLGPAARKVGSGWSVVER